MLDGLKIAGSDSIQIILADDLSDVVFDSEHPEIWTVYLPNTTELPEQELITAQLIIWLLWSARSTSDAHLLKLSRTISATALEQFQLSEDTDLIRTLKTRILLQEYIAHFSPNGYHVLNED